MVVGIEDYEVVVAGNEQPLHTNIDDKAREEELAVLVVFPILHQFHHYLPFGNY